ncbi:hypothetical protein HHK36_027288 [Tetracentron sinense]|uniref:Uncharacterized protein n=1 Tax=Tetracentron sinense TaxID=13715 RepID=A0A834YMV6_TETSI|nr:hypothetical protein HHK36_027288 [Tetracentron sinense]
MKMHQSTQRGEFVIEAKSFEVQEVRLHVVYTLKITETTKRGFRSRLWLPAEAIGWMEISVQDVKEAKDYCFRKFRGSKGSVIGEKRSNPTGEFISVQAFQGDGRYPKKLSNVNRREEGGKQSSHPVRKESWRVEPWVGLNCHEEWDKEFSKVVVDLDAGSFNGWDAAVTPSVLGKIGSIYGGLVEVHPSTADLSDLSFAKIKVAGDLRLVPRVISIVFHSISYTLEINVWEEELCENCKMWPEVMEIWYCQSWVEEKGVLPEKEQPSEKSGEFGDSGQVVRGNFPTLPMRRGSSTSREPQAEGKNKKIRKNQNKNQMWNFRRMRLHWKRKVVESTHIPSVGGKKEARVSAERGRQAQLPIANDMAGSQIRLDFQPIESVEHSDLSDDPFGLNPLIAKSNRKLSFCPTNAHSSASLGIKGESLEKALSPLIQQVEALNQRFREQPPNDVLAEGLELVENGLGLDELNLQQMNRAMILHKGREQEEVSPRQSPDFGEMVLQDSVSLASSDTSLRKCSIVNQSSSEIVMRATELGEASNRSSHLSDTEEVLNSEIGSLKPKVVANIQLLEGSTSLSPLKGRLWDVIGDIKPQPDFEVICSNAAILEDVAGGGRLHWAKEALLMLQAISSRPKHSCLAGNLLNESSPPEFGWKQEKLLLAVKAMNNIEKVILSVAKCQPQWKHLLKSIEARVDKTLGVLRPQALADHRALLASLGWPPALLTSETEIGKNLDLPNPLVLMQGDKRERYSQSFLALCALQHLQFQGEARQLDLLGHKREHNLGLWPIDELVSPIAARVEHHFSKWADQPKFMFALVYKITRDFVVGVDDVLQPLIDKARLVGCSAKEAWVSAMVKMLSGYLAKRILSALAERFTEKNAKSEVIASWLHLVDLIVAFDNQMQSLVSLGTPLFVGESSRFEEIPGGISALSIFCDRPDWLRIWAKIELKDAQKKLKLELEEDRAWLIDTKKGAEFHTEREPEQFLLSTREDHKAPPIAEADIKITWAMIQRCETLPNILLRAQFIRSSAAIFLWKFFKVLLQHCKEAEFTAGHLEDDVLMTVSISIDAARYCEFILREWSEDGNFLEMKMVEDDSNIHRRNDMDDHGWFFGEHI